MYVNTRFLCVLLDGLLDFNWQIGIPIYLGMFKVAISAANSAILQVGLCIHFPIGVSAADNHRN